MIDSTNPVTGRFAPSPTGPLHLGSLYTALASFLQARSQQGRWLLRIDDLDTPRNVKGAADDILYTLEKFGLHWDNQVIYQSQCLERYQVALELLAEKQLLYHCYCSRKTLSENPSPVYPKFCRNKTKQLNQDYALRVKTDLRTISFIDGLQDKITRHIATQDGDFILKRKDQIIAYQFAVVIDDYDQQINQIVRGIDLLTETPKQLYLQQLLELATPDYWHVPLIVDAQGYKLSKQTRATAVETKTPSHVLFRLLALLKQQPPRTLQGASVTELIDWAIAHWQINALKAIKQISI